MPRPLSLSLNDEIFSGQSVADAPGVNAARIATTRVARLIVRNERNLCGGTRRGEFASEVELAALR